MEMGRVAGQYDHASRRIGLESFSIEFPAETNVEDARDDGIDSIFGMLVRHEPYAVGDLHPDDIRTWLGRVAGQNGKPRFRRESRKRRPSHGLREDVAALRWRQRLRLRMRLGHELRANTAVDLAGLQG